METNSVGDKSDSSDYVVDSFGNKAKKVYENNEQMRV